MKQEDKDLLLKDLCARILYGLIVRQEGSIYNANIVSIDVKEKDAILQFHSIDKMRLRIDIAYIKPYLRPMSSMTDEEKEELLDRLPKYWSFEIDKLGDLYFDICDASYPDIELLTNIIDWLNTHHFDYRDLIEKGLAIEVTEENNPYKE